MKSSAVYKLGQNRGKPRVWLQGKQPSLAGFNPGVQYEIEVVKEKNMVALKVSESGSRVVSKKTQGDKEIPVIDINSQELLGLFSGMSEIRVIMSDRAIFILPLASELKKQERLNRLKEKLETNQPILAGSISHGGGILDNALHKGLDLYGVKSKLAFAVDIDVSMLEHAQANNEVWDEETQFIGMPMQELAFDEYASSRLRKVDALFAGIPCAAHSVAARAKKGTTLPEDDPVFGHLVVSFLAILAKVNPAVVVLENVPQYASAASMSIIRSQVAAMDYNVQERILDASDWNCIEARVRMCMVAVTEGIDFNFDNLFVPQKISRKLGEVLDEVDPGDDCWRPYDYLKTKEVRDAAKGNSFSMQLFDENSPNISTLRKFYHKGGSTDPLLRHPTNPDLLRQVNANEHARCKDIPEHLIAGLSKTTAHELLGQSVAYPPFVSVGELLGRSFRSFATVEQPELLAA